MGIQDRDYYKEHHAELRRGKPRRWRRKKRIPVDLIDNANPPWWRRPLAQISWLERFIWAALAIILIAGIIRRVMTAL